MDTQVAVICPTWNRPDKHASLYATFCAQTYPDLELYVLDDSEEPSPFFSALKDARVHYEWAPERLSIGEKRNRLIAEAADADVIVQFDDDDWYAPAYVERMVRELEGVDLVKLSVWNALHEKSGSIWQWDTRTMGGTHYAVTGESFEKVANVPVDQTFLDSAKWGYGFSYVFRRAVWQECPFEDINAGEDYAFLRCARGKGFRVKAVDDAAGLVLHTVHSRSTSVIFPQKRIGKPPQGKTELPAGQKVSFQPGDEFEIRACVKETHPLKELTAKAAAWGIEVVSANESPGTCGDGYREINAHLRATKSGSLPWGVPAPLSWVDHSALVQAWSILPGSTSMVGNPQAVGIEAAQKLGIPVQRHVWGGTEDTLKRMAVFIREDGRSPLMKQFAEMVVRQAGYTPDRNLSTREAASVLLDYVHKSARYREDPDNVESVQAARITLCVPGAVICIPVGDCDDLVVAYASLLIAYGVKGVRILVQDYGDGGDLHVLVAMVDEDGNTLVGDPSIKGAPLGFKQSAKQEFEVDPLSEDTSVGASSPEFVGIGKPHVEMTMCRQLMVSGSCCSSCSSGRPCVDDVKASFGDLLHRAGMISGLNADTAALPRGAMVAIGAAAAAVVLGGIYIAVKHHEKHHIPSSTREMLMAGEGETSFRLRSRGVGPRSKIPGARIYSVKHNGRVIGVVGYDLDRERWGFATKGNTKLEFLDVRGSRSKATAALIKKVIGG